MVVFTCNACCAVLKRNQVDKHCYQCRRCESLSCVDCGTDFWGDDYQQHTKCITEEEKYGGKDNVPKVFKGEAKQEQWVEQVQAAIEKASSKPKLKGLLERLRDYSNIPRKKSKFENFVRNSVRVNSTSLIAEVWDVLMSGNNNNKAQAEKKNESSVAENKTESASISNGHGVKDKNGDNQDDNDESSAPKNKREKKEDRRKKSQKKEKKDKVVETAENGASDESLPKKSKKRKRQESECLDDQANENGAVEKSEGDNGKKKKKNKDKNISSESLDPEDEDDGSMTKSRLEAAEEEEEEEDEPPAKRKKTKFDWEMVIKSVLEKKGEITLKKLKKKVLNEFAAQEATNFNEQNLSAKFDKKVLRIEGVKVHKDRACLKTKK